MKEPQMNTGTVVLEPAWLCSAEQNHEDMPPLLNCYNLESLLVKIGYSQKVFEPHFAELAIAVREWHEAFFGCIPLVQDWQFWLDNAPPNYETTYEQETCYEYHPDGATNLSPVWVMVFPLSLQVVCFITVWMEDHGVPMPDR
jgi:hypothetical protein